jgi:XFP N-terminal domain
MMDLLSVCSSFSQPAGCRSAAPQLLGLAAIDPYWRAANYVSVGQIYLVDNPLLREALRPEHIKPRLLRPTPPAGSATSASSSTPGATMARAAMPTSAAQASARSLVIAAREDLEISRETRSVLTAGS